MKITEDRLREIIQESINKVILEMSPARLSRMDVIRHFQEKHGINRYDYSRVNYVDNWTEVIIGCHEHDSVYWFKQTPHNHKRGDGCPLCNESKMEKAVREYLTNKKIVGVQWQYKLQGSRLRLDFYIEQVNKNGNNTKLGIECQGIQHYSPVKAFGGEKALAIQNERDNRKKTICSSENIILEYIRYDEDTAQRIEEIVRKYDLVAHKPPTEGQL